MKTCKSMISWKKNMWVPLILLIIIIKIKCESHGFFIIIMSGGLWVNYAVIIEPIWITFGINIVSNSG